ncbi:MAG: DUF7662 domain-containing protein [Candidatus Bathyarchaeales archaeon]
MPLKEECGLCGKVLPLYLLKRCFRCKRYYCGSCIEYTDDGNVLCLNCARRMVLPRRFGTKYSSLSRYLARRARFTDLVTLSFHQIEGIIGNSLPVVAFQSGGWWENRPTRAHSHAWLDVGWHVESVDVGKRVVAFRREKGILRTKKEEERGRRKRTLPQKPLPRVKPRTCRKLSKTKMAKIVARLKNIERQKKTPRTYLGKLKH